MINLAVSGLWSAIGADHYFTRAAFMAHDVNGYIEKLLDDPGIGEQMACNATGRPARPAIGQGGGQDKLIGQVGIGGGIALVMRQQTLARDLGDLVGWQAFAAIGRETCQALLILGKKKKTRAWLS